MAKDRINEREEIRRKRLLAEQQAFLIQVDPNAPKDEPRGDDKASPWLDAQFAIPVTTSEKYAVSTEFGFKQLGDGRDRGDSSALDPKAFSGSYDVTKAMAVFEGRYGTSVSSHICARAVREALEASGISMAGHPVNASDYAGFLPGRGFKDIAGGRGGRFEASYGTYQAVVGDIVVINQPGAPGHIAMLGQDHRWHSDFVHGASGMLGGQKFNNPEVTFKVFRHASLLNVPTERPSADQADVQRPNNNIPTAAGSAFVSLNKDGKVVAQSANADTAFQIASAAKPMTLYTALHFIKAAHAANPNTISATDFFANNKQQIHMMINGPSGVGEQAYNNAARIVMRAAAAELKMSPDQFLSEMNKFLQNGVAPHTTIRDPAGSGTTTAADSARIMFQAAHEFPAVFATSGAFQNNYQTSTFVNRNGQGAADLFGKPADWNGTQGYMGVAANGNTFAAFSTTGNITSTLSQGRGYALGDGLAQANTAVRSTVAGLRKMFSDVSPAPPTALLKITPLAASSPAPNNHGSAAHAANFPTPTPFSGGQS